MHAHKPGLGKQVCNFHTCHWYACVKKLKRPFYTVNHICETAVFLQVYDLVKHNCDFL